VAGWGPATSRSRRWVTAACAVIGILLLIIVLPRLLASSSQAQAGPHLLHGSALPSATPLTGIPAPATPLATPTPTPAVSFPDGPLSARPGQRVTLKAQAEPDAECSIQLGYTGAPELDTATADSNGTLSWTWRVSRQAPAGTWPITVSCGGGSASTSLTVSSGSGNGQ
jgi:hypothetical protein